MELDLRKYHGAAFKAKIIGINVIGRISVDGDEVFLCHNESAASGNSVENKLGMEYSWQCLNYDNYDRLKDWSVEDLVLIVESQVGPVETAIKSVTFTYKQVIDFVDTYGSSIATGSLTSCEAFDLWLKDQESSLS